MISLREVSCGARNDKFSKAEDSLYLVGHNISPGLLTVAVVPGRGGGYYKYELSILYQVSF